MYERLVSYFETSPLKRRLYLSVWCTSLSRVRQEMSIPIKQRTIDLTTFRSQATKHSDKSYYQFCLCDQTCPCRKIGQGQLNFTKYGGTESPMPHEKIH